MAGAAKGLLSASSVVHAEPGSLTVPPAGSQVSVERVGVAPGLSRAAKCSATLAAGLVDGLDPFAEPEAEPEVVPQPAASAAIAMMSMRCRTEVRCCR